MERHRISTENAPAALGPYSQAIVSGGFVFFLVAKGGRRFCRLLAGTLSCRGRDPCHGVLVGPGALAL
jgi:hypothetical protein